MTATRAPIPPATRAAACVGIVAAKFDVDELVDLLDELLVVLVLPYGGIEGVLVLPYGGIEGVLVLPYGGIEGVVAGGPYTLDDDVDTLPEGGP